MFKQIILTLALLGVVSAAYKRYEGDFCTKNADCLTPNTYCCDATKEGEIGLMVCSNPAYPSVQTGEYYGYAFKCEEEFLLSLGASKLQVLSLLSALTSTLYFNM